MCSGCGAPRRSMDPYCYYCRAIVADTMEISRLWAAERAAGNPKVPVAKTQRPPVPVRKPEPVQLDRTLSDKLDRFWYFHGSEWAVRVMIALIIGIPFTFVFWCMSVAVMGAGG